ncbi:Maf family protein [Streptococcus sp. 121]|uniref:Maf family protein n=1 Tax=Streptococcus sp. 121 TaxID=2797637 RepID=UPI0018F088A7|nr:Maf family protein [Streptococcus sp. 121]MBJ6746324.1 Maf family protein [Streptococcus sp. 121]
MTHTIQYQLSGEFSPPKEIYLLSQSPRRRELLDFLSPKIVGVDVDERAVEEASMEIFKELPFLERAGKTCCDLALAKARAVEVEDPAVLRIAADTMVVFGETIYNKPHDREEAESMFRSYFGQTHQVVSGVCLKQGDSLDVYYTVADIRFVEYYPELEPVIQAYLTSESPMDKAGAYGFQDLDPRFIDYVAGDVNTIIGLPVAETAKRIAAMGSVI